MLELVVRNGEPEVWWAQEARSPTNLTTRDLYLTFGDESIGLLESLISYYNGQNEMTQRDVISVLNEFGRQSRDLCSNQLPKTSTEWQDFILRLYAKWLKRSTLSLKSRVDTWNRLRFCLETLRDAEDIIPIDIEFPRPRIDLAIDEADEFRDQLIGEPDLKPATRKLRQQVLMDISLARTDAEYLDLVRDTLSYRRGILEGACLTWWRQISEHFRYGQRLLRTVKWESIKPKLNDKSYWRAQIGASHRANGKTEESLAVLLSLLKNTRNLSCTKADFGTISAIPWLCTVEISHSAPKATPGVSKLQRLNWMLGNLSTEDYAYVHLLLTMHHPILAGSAFTNAKLVDRNGVEFLSIGSLEENFRVVKSRAGSTKDATLDELSRKILKDILDMTEAQRDRMRKANDAAANYLLITATLTKPRRCSESLDQYYRYRADCASLGSRFPNVKEILCTNDATFNMRKVRATEAVLEWFRTGSVNAAARRLGNSSQVILEHYLPPQLTVAWNVRLVRRFQNLFIAAAAPPEMRLLKILDFRDVHEIHDFLQSAISVRPFSHSPLGKKLQSKLKEINAGRKDENVSEDLIVSVSSTSLSALYLYQECALDAGFNDLSYRSKIEPNEIHPSDLITLAQLARFRFPNDRDPQIRAAHDAALCELPALRQKLNWTDLMVKVISRQAGHAHDQT